MDMFPDAEALVVAHYKADATVNGLVAGRVLATIPAAPVWPLIRVSRVGGSPTSTWEDEPRISLECWGGTKLVAANLAYAVVAGADDLRGEYAGPPRAGRVSGARVVLGPLWSPDTEVTPPRPRYIVDVEFHSHPI